MKKRLILFVLGILLIVPGFNADAADNSRTVPLHQYYNHINGDHFYTINYRKLGDGKNGYVFEEILVMYIINKNKVQCLYIGIIIKQLVITSILPTLTS